MTPGALIWTPYCGPAPVPGDWRWNLDPLLLVALAAMAAVIAWRSRRQPRLCGLAATAILVAIFISPLCALTSALFSARTVHHVLLVAVAAPLLAWTARARHNKSLTLATAVQALVFWGWHAPAAYESALSSDLTYWLMQASLLISAVWFWIGIRRASAPSAVGHLLVAMVAMGLLGALLTFADQALYVPHLMTTSAWGLTPLEDQRAAGLIMWAPAAALYLAAALIILGRWIGPDRPLAPSGPSM